MAIFKPNGISSVDVIKEKIPTVIIIKEALVKMKMYIDNFDEEIGWLGTAHQEGNNIYITDVMLFDQQVHSTTTELTSEGLSKFGEELLKETNGIDVWNSIKVWGHSHVDMGVFASGQDDAQMVTFQDCGHDWFIRIIGNKKGDMKLDLYQFEQGIVYKNIDFIEGVSEEEMEIVNIIEQLEAKLAEFDTNLEESLKESVESDIKTKVRKFATKVVPTKQGNYYSSYYGEQESWLTKSMKRNDSKKKLSPSEIEEIKNTNIEDGMLENYVLYDVAGTLTLEEARDILEEWGFEGIDYYTDEEINELREAGLDRLYNTKEDDGYYDIYGDYKGGVN